MPYRPFPEAADGVGQAGSSSEVVTPIPVPPELVAEITKMRRNPAFYAVDCLVKCRFCSEKKTAYHLVNAGNEVGSWCSVHGWLYFNSVRFPPDV